MTTGYLQRLRNPNAIIENYDDALIYAAGWPTPPSDGQNAANQIAITAAEIGDYLNRGFLLRMRGDISGQVNLIAASEIKATSHSEPAIDQSSGRPRSSES
jgi:hypothetical protein